MTLARFAEAVRNNEPRYYVHCEPTRRLKYAYGNKSIKCMYGPYIIAKNARRRAKALRKDRVLLTYIPTEETTDLGPSYRKVYIRTEL